MGRLASLGLVVAVVLLSRPASAGLQDDQAQTQRKSSLSAIKALADHIVREQPDSDMPPVAEPRQPARPRAAKDEPKADEKARPAAKPARERREEEDELPVRRPRAERVAPVRRPANNQPAAWNQPVAGQFGGNQALGPAGGGPLWNPFPPPPVYYGGYGYNRYGYRSSYPLGYGYGYGYGSYYGGYGGYFAPPVAFSISGPIDVKFSDPRGSQREALLEGARRSAANPGGLFPNRR